MRPDGRILPAAEQPGKRAAQQLPDLSPRKGVVEVQAVIEYIKKSADENNGRLPAVEGGRIAGLKGAAFQLQKK